MTHYPIMGMLFLAIFISIGIAVILRKILIRRHLKKNNGNKYELVYYPTINKYYPKYKGKFVYCVSGQWHYTDNGNIGMNAATHEEGIKLLNKIKEMHGIGGIIVEQVEYRKLDDLEKHTLMGGKENE